MALRDRLLADDDPPDDMPELASTTVIAVISADTLGTGARGGSGLVEIGGAERSSPPGAPLKAAA